MALHNCGAASMSVQDVFEFGTVSATTGGCIMKSKVRLFFAARSASPRSPC